MSETTNLKLFKHNEPLETNENQFDVDLALNQNWDKIDDAYGNLNTDIENLQTNDNKQDELISKLKNALINAETEEAKSLYVTDANKFGQLEVLGNNEQDEEPSPNYPSEVKCLGSNKQLFDKSTAVEGLLQGDGSLLYSDNNYSTSDFIKVIPKESYCKTITGSSRFKFFDEDKNPISNTYNDLIDPTKAQSFIIPENVHYIRFTFLKTYIDEIKVEKGEQPTSYSPYEQGSTLISKINKNFLNLNNLEVANNNGIDTYTIDNSNQITLKNKTTASETPYSYSFQAFKLNLPAGNYNLSAKVNTNSSNYRIIIRGKKNGNNITSVEVLTQVGNDGNFNIDYSKCDEYTIELYANQDYVEQLVTTTYYDIQIEKGNTATEYVEHKQEDYLLYIQQEMLQGDYFAKEEDGWKEVHGFGKYVFDGTESYIKSSLSDDNYLRAYTNGNTISSSIMEMDGKMFATRYNSIGIYSSTTTDNRIACRPQLHTQISTEFLTENTAEAYKALLAEWKNEGNPLVIFYELVTPTKLPCTEAQSAVLEELSNLELFDATNNIITAEDIALLKLKYALDVETYVDNKLNTINQQILEIAGGN